MNRKSPVPTSADEIRELTRALNEATKDARQERQATERLLARMKANFENDLVKLIESEGREVRELIDREVAHIRGVFEETNRRVREHQAELLGAGSPEELLESFINGVAAILGEKVEKANADMVGKLDANLANITRVMRQQTKAVRLTPDGGALSPLPLYLSPVCPTSKNAIVIN